MTQEILQTKYERIRIINAMDTCNRTKIYGLKFRRMDKDKRLEVLDLVLGGLSVAEALKLARKG